MARRPAALLRQALREVYGLALDGLSDDQLLSAAGGAPGGHVPGAPLAAVVDRLPIDESWLFRDEPLWAWLREEVLPGLVAGYLTEGRALMALSLGCAAGQEAVSLALLIQERLFEAGIPAAAAARSARIVGLDASPARVALAASGATSAWSVVRGRADWLRGKVQLADATTGRWQVSDDVRALCRFEVANLLDVAAPGSRALRGAQLVLCRHVLEDFAPEEARRVVAGLAAALDPGAVLVLSTAAARFAEGLPQLTSLTPLGAYRARTSARATAAAAGARAGAPARATGSAPPASAPQDNPLVARLRLRSRQAATSTAVQGTAGRLADALRDARVATPGSRQLLSRLVEGRELLKVDPERGQAALTALLVLAAELPEEAEVPHAPGLSVRQLTAAVRRLLSGPGPGRE